MTDKTKTQGHELLEQAMKNYEQALQAGLKLQQESARWWMELATRTGSPQEWQSRFNEMSCDSMASMHKGMEENLKLVEQSSRASVDLLKKAMDAGKADTVSAGQAKMQELWDTSLEALRANTTAINQVNAKWVESWMRFVPKTKVASGARAAA
jgi:cell division septum initiation protein DivIVA